jgi:hypothetical protein
MALTVTALLFAGVESSVAHAQGTKDFSGRKPLIGTFKYANLGWPYVPSVAGQDGSANESAAGTDASYLYPDDDEHLWTGDVVHEERSEWEGRRDGAQTFASERLNGDFLIRSLWEFVGATVKS